MKSPKAIGFDLFDTLVTVHPAALEEAHDNLIRSLHDEGFPVERVPFREAYVAAAVRYLRETEKDGRETHNRFWIAAALEELGFAVPSEDPRIARTVEAYFEAFYPNASLLPGTLELLGELSGKYRLGLLSNFTHPPAAWQILERLDLPRFFHTVLISGDLGYRKPHPMVFRELLDRLGEPADRVLFVGDDPEADVQGARNAGIEPVLTNCVADQGLPSVQTLLSPNRAARVPPDVPRISHWEDLLALLESEETH